MDVVASLTSLLVMVGFLKVWRPAMVLGHDTDESSPARDVPRHSLAAVLRGWSPFLLASVFIFLASQPVVARVLNFPALKFPARQLLYPWRLPRTAPPVAKPQRPLSNLIVGCFIPSLLRPEESAPHAPDARPAHRPR